MRSPSKWHDSISDDSLFDPEPISYSTRILVCPFSPQVLRPPDLSILQEASWEVRLLKRWHVDSHSVGLCPFQVSKWNHKTIHTIEFKLLFQPHQLLTLRKSSTRWGWEGFRLQWSFLNFKPPRWQIQRKLKQFDRAPRIYKRAHKEHKRIRLLKLWGQNLGRSSHHQPLPKLWHRTSSPHQ